MTAVVLTAAGLEHTYVANALADALGNRLHAIVVESPSSDPMRSLRRAFNRYGALRVGERILTKVVRRGLRFAERQTSAHHSVLGPCEPRWGHDLFVLRTNSVNSAEACSLLRRVQPTHLFVYGTGLVRGATLAMASEHALNMHTGLSPFYRGSDTEFWPLYRREPHMVGITVHECTADLDGGAIYARASVELEPDDDAFLAFARCVKTGARMYAAVAAHLAEGTPISPVPQDLATGHLYRFADRTFFHDLSMECKFRSGSIRRSIVRMNPQDRPFARPEVGW